jgi:hypothetical protein
MFPHFKILEQLNYKLTTYLLQNGQTKTIDGEGPFPFVFHSFFGDILE